MAIAHANDPEDDGRRAVHLGVTGLINRIIDGGNSVRPTVSSACTGYTFDQPASAG